MSKWTMYQWLTVLSTAILVLLNNIYEAKIAQVFTFVSRWIPPSAIIIFFTIVMIIWGFALILLCQIKKGKPIFIHKMWRIMPAIVAIFLLLSIIVFVIIGTTVLADVSHSLRWILDISIIYFLVLFYLFVLSVFIRYSTLSTNKGKILTSANTTVLILIFVILFLPMI